MGTRLNGVLEVTESGLVLPVWDYLSNTPTSDTDVFRYYQGGVSGIKVATVTVVYTDSTKSTVSTVTRTTP